MGAIPMSDRIDSDFLFYFFLAHDLSDFANEAHLPSIRKSVVEGWRISMPVSLAEQRQIVQMLDEVLEGLTITKAAAEKNLANALAILESHLQSVFTACDDEWEKKQLSEICTEITVGHVGPMAQRYKDSGIPFLRSQNIRPFEASMDNIVFIDAAFHRALSKSRLRPGDLAVVRTGYPGTAAVIPSELPDANCADLVVIRPGRQVDPEYLAAFFNSAFGMKLVGGKLVGAAFRSTST